jgi:hypothetical protein
MIFQKVIARIGYQLRPLVEVLSRGNLTPLIEQVSLISPHVTVTGMTGLRMLQL